MATVVLTINQLSKNYGKFKAVNNLNLQIKAGEIYGILGPNGSGKTTTLGMILGIIKPTTGSYSWFGQKTDANLRKQIGAILETPNFYPSLNATQNLKITAQIKGTGFHEIPRILSLVGLDHLSRAAFKTFSLGMKQRLAIGAALLGNPAVLIFDEPTNGLDPQGIADVRNVLIEIRKQGKTILLASHIIDEVEKICTHTAIIKNGILLASGAVKNLLSTDPIYELGAEDLDYLQQILQTAPWTKRITIKHHFLELQLTETLNPQDLNRYLFEKGVVLTHLVERKKSLETEFLERTQLIK